MNDDERNDLVDSFKACPNYRSCSQVDEIVKLVSEIRDLMTVVNDARGFFKTLGVIGNAIKWLAGVIAAVGLVFATIWYGFKR